MRTFIGAREHGIISQSQICSKGQTLVNPCFKIIQALCRRFTHTMKHAGQSWGLSLMSFFGPFWVAGVVFLQVAAHSDAAAVGYSLPSSHPHAHVLQAQDHFKIFTPRHQALPFAYRIAHFARPLGFLKNAQLRILWVSVSVAPMLFGP